MCARKEGQRLGQHEYSTQTIQPIDSAKHIYNNLRLPVVPREDLDCQREPRRRPPFLKIFFFDWKKEKKKYTPVKGKKQ